MENTYKLSVFFLIYCPTFCYVARKQYVTLFPFPFCLPFSSHILLEVNVDTAVSYVLLLIMIFNAPLVSYFSFETDPNRPILVA